MVLIVEEDSEKARQPNEAAEGAKRFKSVLQSSAARAGLFAELTDNHPSPGKLPACGAD